MAGRLAIGLPSLTVPLAAEFERSAKQTGPKAARAVCIIGRKFHQRETAVHACTINPCVYGRSLSQTLEERQKPLAELGRATECSGGSRQVTVGHTLTSGESDGDSDPPAVYVSQQGKDL